MEKFHYFLYGKQFTLQTDQKPLVSIFRKHMVDVSPRIQRIAIRSWPYDFKTEWIPGNFNKVADALSRVSPSRSEHSQEELAVRAVNILTVSNIQQRDKEALCEATREDAELQALSRLISNGWPQKRSNVLKSLQPYWNYRDEITVEDGILFKNRKILIPEKLKSEYLERIHSGHQGINKCLEKAREFVFWKGYTKHIQEVVEKCILCQETRKVKSTEKFKYISDVPPHPWHTLGSDLFYWKKQDFLVVVDYFSTFLIVRRIPNSTTSAVIKELSMIFSEYGRPYLFRSDNGPCYASQEFQFYMSEMKIEHRTSSPHYPQSNGLAESMVKISKSLIEKAILNSKPWNFYLEEKKSTPISSTIPSPAEILFGRKMKSNLSILPSQLMNDRIVYI